MSMTLLQPSKIGQIAMLHSKATKPCVGGAGHSDHKNVSVAPHSDKRVQEGKVNPHKTPVEAAKRNTHTAPCSPSSTDPSVLAVLVAKDITPTLVSVIWFALCMAPKPRVGEGVRHLSAGVRHLSRGVRHLL